MADVDAVGPVASPAELPPELVVVSCSCGAFFGLPAEWWEAYQQSQFAGSAPPHPALEAHRRVCAVLNSTMNRHRMAELADFDPSSGHRHDCVFVAVPRVLHDCECAAELYAVAADLAIRLALAAQKPEPAAEPQAAAETALTSWLEDQLVLGELLTKDERWIITTIG